MISTEKSRVCSVDRAGALDIRLRKLIHNPHKILKPYIKDGMDVMDLGCGPGFFTIEMAGMVGSYGKVTAVDLQEGMLDIVRKKVTELNLHKIVELYNCRVDKLGLSKTFDFILVFYMLHEVPHQSVLIKELFTLLKPKGSVLIVEPKFHVKNEDFNNSIEDLKNTGFTLTEGPKIFFSRSVIAVKR